MKKILMMAATTAALMTACCSTKQVSTSALKGEWTIETIQGTPIDKNAGEQIPFLGFDVNGNKLYGCTGCNRLSGGLDVVDGKFDWSKLACTRMMCADMTNETKVLQALSQVKWFKKGAKGTLELTDGKGKTIMTLAPKK